MSISGGNCVFLFLSILDQLWRYTKENRLENKSGAWMFQDKTWSIPKDGDHAHAGFIKDQESAMVLTLCENDSSGDNEVILKIVDRENPFGQKWRRSKANEDGWFTFVNPENNEFLTLQSEEKLIVLGNNKSFIF